MIPQEPCSNEVLWEGIEFRGARSGAIGQRNLRGDRAGVLGWGLQSLKGRVLVPTYIFKAVYLPSRSQAGAYFVPNDGSQSWEPISISELESRVSVDVFPQLGEGLKQHAMSLPEPKPHFGCRLRTSEAAQQGSDRGDDEIFTLQERERRGHTRQSQG